MRNTAARIVVFAACLFVAEFSPAVAQPLTEQEALDRAWAEKPFLPGENAIPSWIAHTHRFIYSDLSHGGQMTDFDADTGHKVGLGVGQDAAISPDGHSVLFTATGPDKKGSVLWMMGLDGANRHVIDTGDPLDKSGKQYLGWTTYRWSPDGKHFFVMELSLNQFANVKPSGQGSTVHAYPDDASQDSRLSSKIAVFAADGMLQRSWTVKQAVPDVGWLGNGALLYSHTDGRALSVAHAAVYTFDIATGVEAKLFGGYGRQVTYHPAASPDGQRIAFIADPGEPVFTPGRRELAVFDLRTRAVRVVTDNAATGAPRWSVDGQTLYFMDGMSTQRRLKALLADGRVVVLDSELGQTIGISESDDGKLAAWTVEKPFNELVIHIGPRSLSALHPAQTIQAQPVSFGPDLGTTSGLTWTSTDGTAVDGLLTVPPGFDPSKKYPLIVQVHGGPQGGVEMTDYGWPGDGYFDALLTSRGYLVLRPDYRSSGQLGWDAYMRAKNAGTVLAANRADIESGVQELIDQGVVDPKRIVIIGLSYGGVMTNYIATHSKMFSAAITYEGFDYFIDWGGRPEWPDHNVSMEWEMGGTLFDRMSVYKANSVVSALLTAATPMMLVNGEHGINSGSSPIIYNSLRLRGIDAQFLYYDGEGHGIQQHPNQADFLARIMAWIEKYAPAQH